MREINILNPVIAWWSGGVTSAVACNIAIEWYGVRNVRVIFIDTKNEDSDTYRFKADCEAWYGKEIETLTNELYGSIQEVWRKYKSLNTAHGAICSSELKRAVRLKFQNENKYSYQVFGYDIDEPKRAKSMTMNYEIANPIYLLLLFGYTKEQCVSILSSNGIEIPRAYKLGLNNNNCLQTGCVQGGIGYWQMMQRNEPEKFQAMALMEHELTELRGEPVTMLKDQGKSKGLVFLKHNAKYPDMKDISMMKGREPKPLFECNGFCGTNDLDKNETEKEINYL